MNVALFGNKVFADATNFRRGPTGLRWALEGNVDTSKENVM